MRFLSVLGSVWALPMTLIGLTYVLLFQILGWYVWCGRYGHALVWCPRVKKIPSRISGPWKRLSSQVIGQVVVVRFDPESRWGSRLLPHAQAHVRQAMRLGPFYFVFYALSALIIRLSCRDLHPYWSNPFELEARMAAGQPFDMESLLKTVRSHRGINKRR